SPSALRRTGSSSNALSAASSEPGSSGRSERSYASPSIGAGGFASVRIPSAAPAATAASARYGLASAPGRRHSNRQRSGRAERIARTAHERFSYPHVALIGANHPGTRRLYEFNVGFRSSDAAGRCSRTPPIDDANAEGSGSEASSPANALD